MAKQEDLDKRGEDNLILGTVQIMVGVFCILMWYLLLLLYLKQIKAIFGTYEPITYKAACALWGTLFIATGIVVIKISSKPSLSLLFLALFLNLICITASIAALVLTVIELKNFPPVSYRNYGQAVRDLFENWKGNFTFLSVFLLLGMFCSTYKLNLLHPSISGSINTLGEKAES